MMETMRAASHKVWQYDSANSLLCLSVVNWVNPIHYCPPCAMVHSMLTTWVVWRVVFTFTHIRSSLYLSLSLLTPSTLSPHSLHTLSIRKRTILASIKQKQKIYYFQFKTKITILCWTISFHFMVSNYVYGARARAYGNQPNRSISFEISN